MSWTPKFEKYFVVQKKEEVTFNKLKISTNLTSNHHSDQILTNAIVRMQMQKELNGEHIQEKESMIHKIYQDIKRSHQNTIISFDFIKNILRNIRGCLRSNLIFFQKDECGGKRYVMKMLNFMMSLMLRVKNSYVILDLSLIPAFKVEIKENEYKNIKIVYSKTISERKML